MDQRNLTVGLGVMLYLFRGYRRVGTALARRFHRRLTKDLVKVFCLLLTMVDARLTDFIKKRRSEAVSPEGIS